MNSVSPESAFGRWSLGCSLARPSKGFSRKSRGSGRLPNIRAGKLEVFASSLPPKDAKAALLAELDGAQDRKVLAEAVLALEACNPTREPTKSELIKGRWRFAYNAGIAPGPVPSPTRPLALGMYAGGFTPGAIALAVSSCRALLRLLVRLFIAMPKKYYLTALRAYLQSTTPCAMRSIATFPLDTPEPGM